MADETLVGGIPKVEGAEKPTTLTAEPTIKTYTQKELDEAVGKGRASTQQQLSLSQAEIKKIQAGLKVKEADLKSLQEDFAELERLQTFDEETKEAYINKKALRETQRGIAKAKADLEDQRYELEHKEWQLAMDKKAQELVAETGIDINEFVGCVTQEEMEVKALRFNIAKSKEPKTPQFNAIVPGGGGPYYTNESIAELRNKIINMPQDKAEEAMAELEKALKEGRVKK